MKRKIRADKHSPYIIINGSIHRPVPTYWYYREGDSPTKTHGPMSVKDDWKWVTGSTEHNDGDTVEAKNLNGSPYSVIGGELWVNHGSSHYWDDMAKKMVAHDTETRWAGTPRLYTSKYNQ